MISYGYWIRRQRKALDLTQKELADRIGCALSTIKKIEREERRPSRDMALLLVEHLAIPNEDREAFLSAARGKLIDRDILPNHLVIHSSAYRGDLEGHSQDADPPTHQSLRHNLPSSTGSFIGRDTELADLKRLLAKPSIRLITIVGPGGIGKTRFALAVGEAQIKEQQTRLALFPNGIFFAMLAPFQTMNQIPVAIANAIGYQMESGEQTRTPEQQIIDYLRNKQTLLILDNFEHLLDGGPFLVEILQNAPDVQILITSRERLMLQDEQLYTLHGLELPDEERAASAVESKSVELFVDTARLIHPDFRIDSDDTLHLIRITHLVGGMPLALKLAASWVDVLSLQKIAEEMQHSIDFLETELRDLPTRHRSMRATLSYSWQRLDPGEQRLMAKLSVFRGGFDRDAAQAVADASIRALSKLISKSFLQVNKERDRYDVHELIRQYAAEVLDENAEAKQEVSERHTVYYTSWLQQRGLELKGGKQQEALTALDVDSENAHSGLMWSVAYRQVDAIEKGMNTLLLFYEWRGRYQEGIDVCCVALEDLSPESNHPLRTRIMVLSWLCRLRIALGQLGELEQLLESCFKLIAKAKAAGYDVRYETAIALEQRANLLAKSDIKAAMPYYEKSLVIFQALDARWEMASLMIKAVERPMQLGMIEKGQEWQTESLAIFESLGDKRGIAQTLVEMGIYASRIWKLEQSASLFSRGIALLQDLGDQYGLIGGLLSNGWTKMYFGKFHEALRDMNESVAIAREYGDAGQLSVSYISLAMNETHLGIYTQAIEHCRLALSLARGTKDEGRICLVLGITCEALFGADDFAAGEKAAREGVSISRHSGNHMFLADFLAYQAHALCNAGNIKLSLQYMGEAIREIVHLKYTIFRLNVLSASIYVLASTGETIRAIEVYALLESYPYIAKSHFFQGIAGRHIEALAAALPSDVVAVAQQRGKERDLQSTLEQLATELAP